MGNKLAPRYLHPVPLKWTLSRLAAAASPRRPEAVSPLGRRARPAGCRRAARSPPPLLSSCARCVASSRPVGEPNAKPSKGSPPKGRRDQDPIAGADARGIALWLPVPGLQRVGLSKGGNADTARLFPAVALLSALTYLGPGSPRAASRGAEPKPRGKEFESRHLPAALR